MSNWSVERIPVPECRGVRPERVSGMLLGLAIGDALGNTTESMNPRERRKEVGEIRDYLPNRHADGRKVGLPSDDTQLAFWTIESLLRCGKLEPEELGQTFCSSQIFGLGGTVSKFLKAFKSGTPWDEAGQPSAGNGALMRIAPVILPHLKSPTKSLWQDVIDATVLTHRDEAAVVASIGFVGVLIESLNRCDPPDACSGWWVERFLHYSKPIETGKQYRPRSRLSFRGTLCEFVEEFVRPAVQERREPLEVCDEWYSGAYLLETVPNVLLILELYGQDAEEALIRSVSDMRDNDTVGAIVGAAVGALHGESALPTRWRDNLLGRTREADDGHVFLLISEALQKFEIGERTPSVGSLGDRFRGSLLGLAVGDALGTTIEFSSPGTFAPVTDMVGGGPFGLRPGEWTDDTSMALCLAESLIECRGFNPTDQLERYIRWWREGHLSSTGECFDIGNTVRDALERFEKTREPFGGSTHPRAAGNGSIMRLAPVPLFYLQNPVKAIELAGESSRTTHGTRAAVDACRYMAALLIGAQRGVPKSELLSENFAPVPHLWESYPLTPEIAAIANGSFKHRNPPQIRGTGYVVDSLEAALWALYNSSSFEEGVLKAVNLGDDSDTTGAVFGQLAGAIYGESAIPDSWKSRLAHRTVIETCADRLLESAKKYREDN